MSKAPRSRSTRPIALSNASFSTVTLGEREVDCKGLGGLESKITRSPEVLKRRARRSLPSSIPPHELDPLPRRQPPRPVEPHPVRRRVHLEGPGRARWDRNQELVVLSPGERRPQGIPEHLGRERVGLEGPRDLLYEELRTAPAR